MYYLILHGGQEMLMINNMNQQRVYQFNNSVLRIKFGDIVEADTDVIVNSDDYMLPMVDGLSAYLLKKGGSDISNDAKKKNNAELGDVVVTTAGQLPHKFIYHCITVSPQSRFKQVAEEKQEEMRSEMEEYVIRHSITKCFRLLSSMDLESIAIPCIGVNRAGFSFERVGRIMAETISDFLMKTNKSYRVEFCLLYDPEHYSMMDYIGFFEQFSLRVPTKYDLPKLLGNTISNNTNESKPLSEYDVFISYSHQDKDIALQICSQLDKHGVTYWIDHAGVRHSDDFKEDIFDAIICSEILLFISSVNSNKSRNTIKEVGLAEKNNKVILPVRIDDSPYNKSLEYDLCNRHWIKLNEMDSMEDLGRQINENIRFYLNRKD